MRLYKRSSEAHIELVRIQKQVQTQLPSKDSRIFMVPFSTNSKSTIPEAKAEPVKASA